MNEDGKPFWKTIEEKLYNIIPAAINNNNNNKLNALCERKKMNLLAYIFLLFDLLASVLGERRMYVGHPSVSRHKTVRSRRPKTKKQKKEEKTRIFCNAKWCRKKKK